MQLHWSQISIYTKCAEQFRRRYICGDIIPPSVALVTGKGFHRGVETTLKHKMEKGELPSVGMAQEAAHDAVEKEFTESEIALAEEDGTKEQAKAAAIDTAVMCATMHHNELAPHVNPIAIERPWVINITGYPVQIAGTIDCDEGEIIDDWKSAKKSPSANEAHDSGQITMYSMAKFVCDKIIPRARIGYVVKTKTPKTLWLETTRTKDDFRPMLAVIERISAAIEKEIFPFASSMSPRPWWCSPKWCGYYNTCDGVCAKTTVSVNQEE
jgi:hypothetical protein